MSEQQNIELIRKMYDAFGAGDIKTLLDNASPDAEWVNHGPSAVPYMGNFTGRIPSFFQAMGETTTDGKVTAEKFIAQGDNVIAIGRFTATVRNTGAKLETPLAHIFTIRNGKVTSWIGFSDSAAALAAHTGAASSSARR